MGFANKLVVAGMLLCVQPAWSHPLEGSWQFVSGEYFTPQGDFKAQAPQISSTKVISAGHFNYVTRKNGAFHYAAGGRYEITDTQFIEYIDYGNIPSLLDKRLAFDFELIGDVWHHRLFEQGKLVEYEIWRRSDAISQKKAPK
ncbi:hypothetical protein V1358_00140 [Pseudoalteromonas sp. YIC-656]|uniref:hypothetical protein n=1 Tax=Pseudoalteromonas pernae TaxID=3118054 RepID=UPI003241D115